MNRKKTLLLVGLALLGIGVAVLNRPIAKSLSDTPVNLERGPKNMPTLADRKLGAPVAEALKPVAPWDYYKPLTADEKKEFEVVEGQVKKFLTWGKMDTEAVPAFRQSLFKMGDRAIADLARGLSQLSKEEIKDKADAEGVVQKIDTLGYFANSSNPLAADSIAQLATRPVSWSDGGELLNPVEANITFEMFDLFSRYRPGEATTFIGTIDKKHRTAYFTHYAYGRKLAGKTMDEIDGELKAVFGSPELALR